MFVLIVSGGDGAMVQVQLQFKYCDLPKIAGH
jgi:hypothetical protein